MEGTRRGRPIFDFGLNVGPSCVQPLPLQADHLLQLSIFRIDSTPERNASAHNAPPPESQGDGVHRIGRSVGERLPRKLLWKTA